MIDAHAHIQMPPLSTQWEALYDRAKTAGLSAIVLIGESVDSSQAAVRLAQERDDLWATIGVHPEYATGFGAVEREAMERLIAQETAFGRPKTQGVMGPMTGGNVHAISGEGRGDVEGHAVRKIRAIGEIGLDYHWIDPTDPIAKKAQWDAFEWQIDFANRHDLPIVIHSREAGEDTLSIIGHHRPRYALMHCYSYDISTAERFLALDERNMVAFTGILTYPNAHVLRDVCSAVDLTKMVTESDCPYLAPQKYRGRQNEPAYITEIVAEIARLKNTSFEQAAQATGENARKFFGFLA